MMPENAVDEQELAETVALSAALQRAERKVAELQARLALRDYRLKDVTEQAVARKWLEAEGLDPDILLPPSAVMPGEPLWRAFEKPAKAVLTLLRGGVDDAE